MGTVLSTRLAPPDDPMFSGGLEILSLKHRRDPTKGDLGENKPRLSSLVKAEKAIEELKMDKASQALPAAERGGNNEQ